MNHLNLRGIIILLICVSLALFPACSSNSQTKASTPDGGASTGNTNTSTDGNSAPSTTSGSEITVLCTALNENGPALQAFVDENLDFTVRFEAEPLSYADVVNKMTTMLASGDESVDVFHVDEIMQLAFLSAGFLEPIDDVVTEEDINHFLPGYAEAYMKRDGKTYSVPADIGGILFFVNQTMFKEAGIEYPTNQEEFIAAAQALTKDGKYGLLESWDKASHLQDNLNRWCLMFGGNFYDWNLEGSQQAIRFMYDLVNTYKVVNIDNLSDNQETSNQKMIDGMGAMYFQWAGCTNAFSNAGKYGDADSEIISVPMPTFVTNKTPMSSWMWSLNKNSTNMDAAKEFMKLMVSEEAQSLYMKSTWRSPTGNVDAWNNDTLMQGLNAVPEHRAYLEAGSLTARTLSSKHSEYMDTVTGTLQRYLLDEITFDECIERGQNEINKILASLE